MIENLQRRAEDLADSVRFVLADFAHTYNIDLVDKGKLFDLYNKASYLLEDILLDNPSAEENSTPIDSKFT